MKQADETQSTHIANVCSNVAAQNAAFVQQMKQRAAQAHTQGLHAISAERQQELAAEKE